MHTYWIYDTGQDYCRFMFNYLRSQCFFNGCLEFRRSYGMDANSSWLCYRYSEGVVYNNFLWPNLDIKQKDRIEAII